MRRSLARIAVFGVSAFLLALAPAGAGAASHAAKGGLDCNGFSPQQTTFRPMLCTEIAARGSGDSAFEDNGHYIGHDEPSIGFYSNKPGSGNRMTYVTRLPK